MFTSIETAKKVLLAKKELLEKNDEKLRLPCNIFLYRGSYDDQPAARPTISQ